MSVFYEPGVYRCEILSQAVGEASTGTPQFAFKFRVLTLVVGEEERSLRQTYERTCYRYMTEKAMPYFLEDLKTLGFSGASFRFLDPETPGFHDFTGQTVYMVCNHDKNDKGDDKEVWNIRRETSSLELKKLEPKKMRDLDNLFGKALKDAVSGNTKKPATQSQPAAAAAMGVSDDDVPF